MHIANYTFIFASLTSPIFQYLLKILFPPPPKLNTMNTAIFDHSLPSPSPTLLSHSSSLVLHLSKTSFFSLEIIPESLTPCIASPPFFPPLNCLFHHSSVCQVRLVTTVVVKFIIILCYGWKSCQHIIFSYMCLFLYKGFRLKIR